MTKAVYFIVATIISFAIFFSCTTKNDDLAAGEQLARNYCASCHIFPSPNLLDKKTWAGNVLPVMGKNFGIVYYAGQPYPENVDVKKITGQVTTQSSSMPIEDWVKIANYYQASAPDTLPGLSRPPVQQFTNLFTVQEVLVDKGFPSAGYVKIDPGNKWIYAANATDSAIYIYDKDLKKIADKDVHGVVVDMNFDSGLSKPGERKGSYTNIGYINPNDQRTGNAYTFNITKQGAFTRDKKIADSMPRPVQVTACDLDKDGKTDYLVCGFGNKAGEFYWLRNKGDGTFEKKMLWNIPGAIKAYIDDYDKDGLPDIMVLFAQAQEGIYLFTNKGNGNFEKKDLLRFPPVYGSNYFELVDMNNDGYKDILYSCGDNADYTAKELKSYHGLYIFANDGHNNFKQSYFFPMYGCYKAMVKDFDKDGDLDIVAISFFPDKKNRPQESFLYLENKGGLQFVPYAVHGCDTGNWITMDAADLDGDGDDDVVIGNFDMHKIRSNSHDQQKNAPAFLVLQNNTIPRK